MGQGIQWTKENLWKTAFKKIEVIWYAIPLQSFFHFNFFKGCLPQILLCPFLNNLTHIILYQLAKCYYQKLFTSQDIKQFVFLNSSSHTWQRHKLSNLSSFSFFYKFSNDDNRKKMGRWKYKNLITNDKRKIPVKKASIIIKKVFLITF